MSVFRIVNVFLQEAKILMSFYMCPDRFIIKIVSATGYFMKSLLIPIIAILMVFTGKFFK